MSGDSPDIRLAHPENAPAIAAMLARLAEELGESDHFSTTAGTISAHGFGPSAAFSTMIAGPADALTGLALFFRHFSTLRGAPGAYVQDLWVAPDQRSQHLGQRLLAAVAAHAATAWGAAYLALTVHDTNPGATRFYDRLGFNTYPGARLMVLPGPAFHTLSDTMKARP
ncbi:GNAT family N-acetyltransferase [Marimonas arenosa]|uniref:GNAT family N-acetyltransferase n=1 Tax=Marimonas arenosa TaxID=1795305 RepID=A0AAE3WFN0_9RHOB|nr:GNAT family N-acetyltransferase [Marimonas arenosa]MDQ2091824.1 GNAT family N-acetyltransferase [Marimonas arenosa]